MSTLRRWWPFIACLLLGLSITALMHGWRANRLEKETISRVTLAADKHVKQQIAHLQQPLAVLDALNAFFHSNPDPSPRFFQSFASALQRTPGVSNIFVAEMISAEQRRASIEHLRDWYPDFALRERNAAGLWSNAQQRDSYTPVIYGTFDSDAPLTIGLDLSTEAQLATALNQLNPHELVVSEPYLNTKGNTKALLLQPRNIGDRRFYFGISFSPTSFNPARDELAALSTDVWFDATDAKKLIPLQTLTNDVKAAGILAQRDITLGNRIWRIETRLNERAIAALPRNGSTEIWLGGLFLTALLLLLIRAYRQSNPEVAPIDPTHTQEAEIQQLLDQAIETASVAQRDNLRLKTILDTANEAVVLIDQRGLIELFNSAAEKLFGYDNDEVLGTNVQLLMPTAQRKKHDEALERFVTTGQSRVMGSSRELLAQHKDGKVFPIELSLNEFRLADNHYFVGVMRDISDRKRTERMLLESELKHRAILDAAFIGIYVQQDGKLRFVNPTFCNYFDLRSSELIETKALEHLVAPSSRFALDQALNVSSSGGRPTELVMERPDGSRFYALLTAKPILFDHKHGIAGSLLDISERKAAEEAMLRAEIKNVAILDAVPDLMIHLDSNGMLLDSRVGGIGGGSVSFGISNDVVGEHYKRALPPDLAQQLDDLLRKPLRERPRSFEYVIPIHANKVRSFEARVTPMGIGEQLLMVRDISERKAIEAELIQHRDHLAEMVKERTAELNSLFATSPLATVLLSHGQILEVNNAFVNLFGYSRHDLIGDTFHSQVADPEAFERINSDVYPRLADGDVVSFEARYRKANQHTVLCEVFGKAVNADDPSIGSIWVYQDISQRRAAETALKQAKEIAEAANEAKTEFLANMSHELRTPMHAVLSFAELGAGRARAPEQEKLLHYFERIRQSGQRLLQMLNDLLDLSKLDAGKMRYEMRMARLEPVFEEVLEELATLCRPRRITIGFTPDANSPAIPVDPQRMGQVLRNLVANAVKFSPEDGHIKVSLEYADTSVTLTVEDEGIGIPAEELERIFDKFTQSSKTKTGAGGTGLGLTICREIVAAHGGKIHAENRAESGARFVVTLPRQIADQ